MHEHVVRATIHSGTVEGYYRVGALGCLDLSSLSTRDVTIEDNLFLRDLGMALRWVRDNIAVFGGDPDNVTIFDESAGAQAVATLLAVPAATSGTDYLPLDPVDATSRPGRSWRPCCRSPGSSCAAARDLYLTPVSS